MQGAELTRKQFFGRSNSALTYIHMRLASTGFLWRLLLEYPMEAGTISACLPAELSLPQSPCFEEDYVVTSAEETRERKRCEAEFTSQFLLAAPNNVAIYCWPSGQISSYKPVPQAGKLYHYQETSVQGTSQGRNAYFLEDNYLVLTAEEGSVEHVLEGEESIPNRRFCCLLTNVPSSVFAHPERLLDDAALRQLAASAEHLLVSAFDHYAKLLWTSSTT